MNETQEIKPLWERPHSTWSGGIQRLYGFENGYGASVIRAGTEHNSFSGSYGADSGLWELAVITIEISDDGPGVGRLVYDTPITDDVLGYLTEDDVQKTLLDIAGLVPRGG